MLHLNVSTNYTIQLNNICVWRRLSQDYVLYKKENKAIQYICWQFISPSKVIHKSDEDFWKKLMNIFVDESTPANERKYEQVESVVTLKLNNHVKNQKILQFPV